MDTHISNKNTFQAIEITTDGVFYWPDRPKEPMPKDYGIGPYRGNTNSSGFIKAMDEYKHALKTAIRYPVNNQEYTKDYVKQKECMSLGKDGFYKAPIGIYPYDGEVEVKEEITYTCEEARCTIKNRCYQQGKPTLCEQTTEKIKVVILIEPPANVPENPDSSKVKAYYLAGGKAALEAANPVIQSLREDNKKLKEFKSYVHDRLDKMSIPSDPEPSSSQTPGCRIEGRLNYIEGLNRERIEAALAAYFCLSQHNPERVSIDHAMKLLTSVIRKHLNRSYNSAHGYTEGSEL